MKACNSCGKCCETAGNGGLSAMLEEVAKWEIWRPDIARFVDGRRIWVDPETGDYLARCPWLKSEEGRTRCEIYDDRPEDCRHYPVDIEQMVRHECEMLEPRDLGNYPKAQKALDKMMADSRPPVRSQ